MTTAPRPVEFVRPDGTSPPRGRTVAGDRPRRVAIVGSGVSGLVVASDLHPRDDIAVFEAGEHVGGHVNTVEVEHEGRVIPVDTGFIVCNDRNYPTLLALFDELGVETIPAPMSFSVRCDRTGLEWGGGSISGLFAQRRNVLRPSFHRFLRDFFRFNAAAGRAVSEEDASVLDLDVGTYLEREGYGPSFAERYLVPMAAAIWSAPARDVRAMPLRFLARFFHQHGMLQVRGRPTWRTVRGGGRTYVETLTRPFRDRIRLRTPVLGVRRDAEGVTLRFRTPAGTTDHARFDEVVLACHSDQALAMLEAPTEAEREILGAIPYQRNETVLHSDERLLPRRRAARACWNYHLPAGSEPDHVVVTYDLTMLQSLGTRVPLCVTLNETAAIDPQRVLGRFTYHHPVFSRSGLEAQDRWAEISGAGTRTHYAGAYWRYGFHEDGAWSGRRVSRALGAAVS